MKKELINEITNKIIATLESGSIPIWERPFIGERILTAPKNANSKRVYQGFNYWNLIAENIEGKFLSNDWVTFKQALDLGGSVRKGSKGSRVLFYKMMMKKDETKAEGETSKSSFPMMRYSTVFNLSQIEGLEEQVLKGQKLNTDIESRQDIKLLNLGADFVFEPSLRACYKPAADVIQLPNKELFKDQNSFYATLFHEIIHWTGHKTRLKRPFTGAFGSKNYAFEELVAEFGASCLCAHYGFKYTTQHAAYIADWHQVLKQDQGLLISATSKAQKAANFVIDLLDGVDEELEAAKEYLTENEIEEILNNEEVA